MKFFQAALLSVALFLFTNTAEAVEPPLPDNADIGFTRYIQHYPIGSHDVLVFQMRTQMGPARFGVSPDFAEENIELLRKFIKWADMAKEHGDILNKEIGMVKGFDFGLYNYWNRYEFVTNEKDHQFMLAVTSGTKTFGFGFEPKSVDEKDPHTTNMIDYKLHFDQDQVRQLIQRIDDFKNGKTKSRQEVEKDYK